MAGVEIVVPKGDRFDATHDAYISMGTAGQATQAQRELLFGISKDLCDIQGAEAMVLGGTDLFLAFSGYDCGFPAIDSAQVHIDALNRASIRKHP